MMNVLEKKIAKVEQRKESASSLVDTLLADMYRGEIDDHLEDLKENLRIVSFLMPCIVDHAEWVIEEMLQDSFSVIFD